MALFHLLTRQAWAAAQAAGEYRPATLQAEGFIHLSTADQWPRTLQRFFKGQRELLLLTVDQAKLKAEVKLEAADGELFPHLYGPLNLDAVSLVTQL